ncbi:MAG: hypothetical protein IT326_01085 [Anaerolineae bacterium]|nr:hypothetical protein [Anaerolineae bacterium]
MRHLLDLWNGRKPITKRLAGIGVALAGLGIVLGVLAVDFAGFGKETGLGPSQRLAIAGGVTVLLAGLPLIALGDRPA